MTTPHASPLLVFLLVFVRVTGALVAAPIFGEKDIPPQIKVGLSALIAGILTPNAILGSDPLSGDPLTFAILLLQQLLLGLVFALIFVAVYRTAESAGELIGQQIGVTLGSFAFPGQGELQTIGGLYHLVAGLLFLSLDAHHWVILGLGASLDTLPVTRVALSPALINTVMPLGGAALQFALGLALPLLAVLLAADILTGLLGRAIPSLNMFVLGLPVKVVLGFAGVMIAAPFTVPLFTQILQHLLHLQLWG